MLRGDLNSGSKLQEGGPFPSQFYLLFRLLEIYQRSIDQFIGRPYLQPHQPTHTR